MAWISESTTLLVGMMGFGAGVLVHYLAGRLLAPDNSNSQLVGDGIASRKLQLMDAVGDAAIEVECAANVLNGENSTFPQKLDARDASTIASIDPTFGDMWKKYTSVISQIRFFRRSQIEKMEAGQLNPDEMLENWKKLPQRKQMREIRDAIIAHLSRK